MKLLLTSAGMNVREEIIKILPRPAHQVKLAHIITAAKAESNQDYMLKDKQQMKELGFDVEDIDIEGKNENELINLLENKDIICVQGGNTFYLLKAVRKSGFDKVINKLILQGKIYIGISAGSYIACPTIVQSTWKHQDRNHIGLTDFTALNLVPFILVAHFKERYRKIIEDATKTTKYPVVALSDTQAILVEDHKYKLVGKGNREFFNGFKENI